MTVRFPWLAVAVFALSANSTVGQSRLNLKEVVYDQVDQHLFLVNVDENAQYFDDSGGFMSVVAELAAENPVFLLIDTEDDCSSEQMSWAFAQASLYRGSIGQVVFFRVFDGPSASQRERKFVNALRARFQNIVGLHELLDPAKAPIIITQKQDGSLFSWSNWSFSDGSYSDGGRWIDWRMDTAQVWQEVIESYGGTITREGNSSIVDETFERLKKIAISDFNACTLELVERLELEVERLDLKIERLDEIIGR